MAWFKVDDRFGEHPKILQVRAAAGYAPIGLWVCAGTWSNAQMTDGLIPDSWVALNATHELAEVLLDAGLWTRSKCKTGYQFKDFNEYQPSKAELKSKREKDLNRKKLGGSRSFRADSTRNPSGIQTDSGSPVPVPVPEPHSSTKSVTRKTVSSERELRNRKRLGLVVEGGNAA